MMLPDLHMGTLYSNPPESVTPDLDYAITPFVSEAAAGWLEREYESVFAVKEYADLFHPYTPKYAFARVNKASGISNVIVFELRGKQLHVLSKVCPMDGKVIEDFCRTCFKSFPHVRLIAFEKIRVQPEFSGLTYLVTEEVGDFVIELPERTEQYPSILSKNLRKSINCLSNRVKRDFPGCTFEAFEKERIPPGLIEAIVRMNGARMRAIGKARGHGVKEMEKLAQLAQKYGLVCCMRSGGEWLAGNINFIVGGQLFGYINAFNIKYSYYKLGMVCSFQSNRYFIEKGIKKVRLLWGEYEYKYQLGAKKVPLYSFEVLRYPWMAPWRRALNFAKRFLEHLQGATIKRVFLKLRKRLNTMLRQIFRI